MESRRAGLLFMLCILAFPHIHSYSSVPLVYPGRTERHDLAMGLSQEDRLCECLLILTALLHVLVCPFSKVEETLNLHAIHDILTKGLSDKAISQVGTCQFSLKSHISSLTAWLFLHNSTEPKKTV